MGPGQRPHFTMHKLAWIVGGFTIVNSLIWSAAWIWTYKIEFPTPEPPIRIMVPADSEEIIQPRRRHPVAPCEKPCERWNFVFPSTNGELC